MSKAPLFALIAASVVLSGCATLTPPRPDVVAARNYSDSQESVWRRILATSARQSMFIRQADSVNGVITADREISSPRADIFENNIFDWAECEWTGPFDRILSQRIEVNYLVRPERNGTTTVTLNARFQELRMNVPLHKSEWVNCTSTGVLERSMLEAFYYDVAT
jgi:hypothetical protein